MVMNISWFRLILRWDIDQDGHLDVGQDFYFDMLSAANMGLCKFQGFNLPMGMDPYYEWYPSFAQKDDLITMKLPDGSLMKMFLQMQAQQIADEEQRNAFLAAVENYPAFSNGITLGGHGVRPKSQALGSASVIKVVSTVMENRALWQRRSR